MYYSNTIIVEDGKIFLNGKQLPSLPTRKKNLNPLVVGDEVYINGFELRDGKWKRSFRAWLAQYIGYCI
jgi:hypothetical protein